MFDYSNYPGLSVSDAYRQYLTDMCSSLFTENNECDRLAHGVVGNITDDDVVNQQHQEQQIEQEQKQQMEQQMEQQIVRTARRQEPQTVKRYRCDTDSITCNKLYNKAQYTFDNIKYTYYTDFEYFADYVQHYNDDTKVVPNYYILYEYKSDTVNGYIIPSIHCYWILSFMYIHESSVPHDRDKKNEENIKKSYVIFDSNHQMIFGDEKKHSLPNDLHASFVRCMFNSRKMTLPDLTRVVGKIKTLGEYNSYARFVKNITTQSHVFWHVIYDIIDNKKTDDRKYILERILHYCGLTGHSIESDLIRLSGIGLEGGNYVYIPLIYKNIYKQNKRQYMYIINNKMI